jgi:hypothetical protein
MKNEKKKNQRGEMELTDSAIPDDMLFVQLPEQANLTDGRAWDTLVLCLEPNLLQRDNAASREIFRLVDDPVRP